MRKLRHCSWAISLVAGSAWLSGCGARPDAEPAPESASEVVGSGELRLSVSGASLDRLSYTISGPGGFTRAGTIALASSSRVSALIGGLPAGIGFSITLSGSTVDGSTTCGGGGAFDVLAGKTSSLSVAIACREAAKTGSVRVDGALDSCPAIDGLSASPSAVYLGKSLALEAQAHDADAGPAALSFHWSSSSGTLSGLSPDKRSFTCTSPGSATISLSVSDGNAACDASDSITVDCSADASATFYTTKTPYRPQQDAASYEPPPSGFGVVFTQLVARHGSRGLSSVKYDAAALNMWKQAQLDGALTARGASLGADITRLMKANALLDFGVAGITTPGYGNLTRVGISEQQNLAARLVARHSAYFAGLAAGAGAAPRAIQVVSSGVDRAVDSAAFFAGALVAGNSGLAPLLVSPPAPTGYPAGAPITQPAGTNRFLLYSHKLVKATDLVTDPGDPNYQTYQDSQAYQAYASNADLNAKLAAIAAEPASKAAARAVLEGLFAPAFVDKIDDKTYTFANTGSFSFTSDDGRYSATVSGDGKTKIQSLTDAASMLYNLYVIAPAMRAEAGVDFDVYLPPAQARELAYLQDAQDFYQIGPGIAQANPVTYAQTRALLDDFFEEVDAIASGNLSHGAKLRFTHAEIIAPFASLLGLEGVFVPVPLASTYDYDHNSWRGELVSPMAANVQWDVYENAGGELLVKMLYNEKETEFKAGCDGARYTDGSHYYVYDRLMTCYGHTP